MNITITMCINPDITITIDHTSASTLDVSSSIIQTHEMLVDIASLILVHVI